MRYSSSSASRSPCWARSTRRRTFSFDSRDDLSAAAGLIRMCFPRPGTGLTRAAASGRREAHAARPVEAAEVRHLRDDNVIRALLGVEDDHPRPVLVQRPLELVGRLQRRERREHLPALEPDLEPYPIAASHSTPPP